MKRKTLAHEFLDIERECGFEVDQSCYKTIDDLLEKASERINIEDDPRNILSSIGGFLKEEDFRIKNNGLLSDSLQTKIIDCKLSVLYYSIAERLGLGDKLSLVLAPKHVFVRWNDGENTFNWDATINAEVSDEEYKSRCNIHEQSVIKDVYLRSLTRELSKAIAYDTCGCVKYGKGDLDGAIACHEKAIRLNPMHVRSYCYKGFSEGKKGNYESAFAHLAIAMRLDPNYARPYYYSGRLQVRLKDYQRAIVNLDKAIELNPDHPSPYYYRGQAKTMIRDSEAMKDFEMYKKLRK